MAEAGADKLSETARHILGYFQRHGKGQDTVEGIAEWWLMEKNLVHGLEETRKALSELIALGMVEEIRQGNRSHFRLKQPEP